MKALKNIKEISEIKTKKKTITKSNYPIYTKT